MYDVHNHYIINVVDFEQCMQLCHILAGLHCYHLSTVFRSAKLINVIQS